MVKQDSAEYQTVEACDENYYPDASFGMDYKYEVKKEAFYVSSFES